MLAPPLRKILHDTSSPRDLEPKDAGLEALQKWHEERLEKKLRGEYESAVRKLGEVVSLYYKLFFLTFAY